MAFFEYKTHTLSIAKWLCDPSYLFNSSPRTWLIREQVPSTLEFSLALRWFEWLHFQTRFLKGWEYRIKLITSTCTYLIFFMVCSKDQLLWHSQSPFDTDTYNYSERVCACFLKVLKRSSFSCESLSTRWHSKTKIVNFREKLFLTYRYWTEAIVYENKTKEK